MSEIAIPEASLARLRGAYNQFEQLTALVAEAMGLDPLQVQGINLPQGVIILKEEPGVTDPARANGVTA